MTPPAARLLASGDPALIPGSELAVARARVLDAVGPTADQRRPFLELLAEHDDALVRSCLPGHLTGSAFVVDASGERALLLFHAKLGRWLQPGGHADGEADSAAVALREATEESGIEGLRVAVPAIDLDIHEVAPPGEPAHLHFDVRFLVVAPPDAEVRINHESRGARWVTAAELATADVDTGLRRLARRGFALAATLTP